MHTIIRNLSRETLLSEVPALCISLAVAEFFYKFHSFILECTAFLATWLLLSYAISFFIRKPAAVGRG